VYNAIHAGDPSPDLLAIKYLETLGRIANGQATKIFLPADFSSGLGAIGAVAELFKDDGGGATGRAARAAEGRSELTQQFRAIDKARSEEAARDVSDVNVPPPVVDIPEAPTPPPPDPPLPPL
jgi:hypothetical protein